LNFYGASSKGQDLAKLEYPLGATINGIAAGLHNTG
jgi:phosphoenolpyruvate carboxylase